MNTTVRQKPKREGDEQNKTKEKNQKQNERVLTPGGLIAHVGCGYSKLDFKSRRVMEAVGRWRGCDASGVTEVRYSGTDLLVVVEESNGARVSWWVSPRATKPKEFSNSRGPVEVLEKKHIMPSAGT